MAEEKKNSAAVSSDDRQLPDELLNDVTGGRKVTENYSELIERNLLGIDPEPDEDRYKLENRVRVGTMPERRSDRYFRTERPISEYPKGVLPKK